MATLSSSQHRTLVALAETALPAGRFLPAANERTVERVERFVATLPMPAHFGLEGLLRSLDVQSWVTTRRAFADAPDAKRLAILQSWRQGDPVRRLMLRALVSPLKIAHFDDPGLYQKLGCVYEARKQRSRK